MVLMVRETGLAAGLSREAIAAVFEQIGKQADAAIENTFSALPENFPTELTGSIEQAIATRKLQLQ